MSKKPEAVESLTREQCVRIDNLIGQLHTLHSKYKAAGIHGVSRDELSKAGTLLEDLRNHATNSKDRLYESADFYKEDDEYGETTLHTSERDALEEWGHTYLEETPVSEEMLKVQICEITAYNKKTVSFEELRGIAYCMADKLDEDLQCEYSDGETSVVPDRELAAHVITEAITGLVYDVSTVTAVATRKYTGIELVSLVRKEFPEWIEGEHPARPEAETPKSNEVLPEQGYVVWFARGGDIQRSGPFKTQLEATQSLRLRHRNTHAPEVPVFPPDAFVWCEEAPERETDQ